MLSRKILGRACCATAAAFALSATPVPGQEPRDTIEIAPLVVTANRIPLGTDGLTAAVTVIPGAELEARGIRYVSEALAGVPGAAVVPVGSYGGVTSLFLRGGESDYVKVLVDGIPVNMPGGAYNFANLTTDNVDRIEIVRGPASVHYGSDAMTGVIQVFTKSGGDAMAGEVRGAGGSHERVVVGGGLSGRRGPVHYSVAGSRLSTAGTYAFNNRYTNATASGSIGATLDDHTKGVLHLRWEDNTVHFPTDGAGVPVDSNQASFDESLALAIEVDRRLSERAEAKLTLTRFALDGGFEDLRDHPADTVGFAFASRRRTELERRSIDLRFHVLTSSGLVLTLGSTAEHDHERQQGQTSSNFGAGQTTELSEPFDTGRWNLGTYVEGLVDLPLPASLHLGARLDENQAFGTFFTYRTGVVVRVGSRTRIRSSLGTGFKAPSFAENFADAPFERGNPALGPERSRSWEIGAEHRPSAGLSVWAAYFDQRFTDLVQYVFADPSEPTYLNLPEAKARGVEAGVRAEVAPGVHVTGQYTYLDTETIDPGSGGEPGSVFEKGRPLLRRPAHSARVGALVQVGKRGSLAIDVNWVGGRDDLAFENFSSVRVRLPAYTTVSLSTAFAVAALGSNGPKLRATLKLENVFDHAYETVVGFPGRGRAVMAGATLRF